MCLIPKYTSFQTTFHEHCITDKSYNYIHFICMIIYYGTYSFSHNNMELQL